MSAHSPVELNNPHLSYLVQMRENADQNNSEYGHFSESVILMLNIWRWDIFAGFQLTVFEKKCSFRKISKYSHCDALQKLRKACMTHLVLTERFNIMVCKMVLTFYNTFYSYAKWKYLPRTLLRKKSYQKKLFR